MFFSISVWATGKVISSSSGRRKDISYLRYYFNDSYEVDDARGVPMALTDETDYYK